MIKFTYMNSAVAFFGTLYDDIWRGLPITSNLRLPEEEYHFYTGELLSPHGVWELEYNQEALREARKNIKDARRRLNEAIDYTQDFPDLPRGAQPLRIPPLTPETANEYNRLFYSMQEKNEAKNRITQLARKYSNTPFNTRFRNLP